MEIGKEIRGISHLRNNDDGSKEIEFKFHNRRLLIHRTFENEVPYYVLYFTRYLEKKEFVESIKQGIIDNRLSGEIIKNRVWRNHLVLSEEAYEALMIGFFNLSIPNLEYPFKISVIPE